MFTERMFFMCKQYLMILSVDFKFTCHENHCFLLYFTFLASLLFFQRGRECVVNWKLCKWLRVVKVLNLPTPNLCKRMCETFKIMCHTIYIKSLTMMLHLIPCIMGSGCTNEKSGIQQTILATRRMSTF